MVPAWLQFLIVVVLLLIILFRYPQSFPHTVLEILGWIGVWYLSKDNPSLNTNLIFIIYIFWTVLLNLAIREEIKG